MRVLKLLLLLLPCLLACMQIWWNFDAPRLGGMPFYYWLNLALVPFSSLCIWLASKAEDAQ